MCFRCLNGLGMTSRPDALGLLSEGDCQPVDDLNREHECLDQDEREGDEQLNERQQSVEVGGFKKGQSNLSCFILK